MGVIHKLKPAVKNFILEQKNKNPALSCRKLSALVLDNFKVEVSKSSINMIIKEAGLSAPIGRTPKKKKHHIAMPQLPVLLEDTSAKEAEEARRIEKEKWQKLAEEERKRREEIQEAEEENKARSGAEKRAQEEAEKLAREAAEKTRTAEKERLEQEAKKKAEEEAVRKTEEENRIRTETEKRAKEEAEKESLRKKEEADRLTKEAEEKARLEEDKKRQEARARQADEAKEASLRPEGVKSAVSFNIDRFAQIDNTGLILLKAADSIIGASQRIAAAVKGRLGSTEGDFNAVIENLIYLPLLKEAISPPAMDKLSACLKEIESIKVMNLDILRIITLCLQEVRCVRMILSDGENVYLDGQMYSVWSSPHIPYDFVSPIHNLKKYINKYFNEGQPLVLFNAPGYDMPSSEFFSLLAAFDAQSSSISNMILYGNKFNELEVIPVTSAKKRFIIFGLWPWQFTECRKVKNIGQFRRLHLEPQNSDFYIADIEMSLSHPRLGRQVSLSGCAVKTSLSEKTRLVILSNLSSGDKSSEELAATYLNHWPNLDEAFQDYSHKIELFTYAANSQRFFSAEKLNPQLDHVLSVEELLRNYLLALDAYVRWYLLPSGYADKELALIKERFYDLEIQLAGNNESRLAGFILPPEYSFGKDLGYLCHRLNEKEVVFSDGLKLYFK
ncbi:MAG: hypothetical protein KA022_00710 [Candidatus Omnitrophica bacterium]|nr:hypothetical protein [Candidatus Omnitrophota bacterium]